MHVSLLLWYLATQKLFYKILFGPSYLQEYYRYYKREFYLMSLVVEGSIKKIKFSSSLPSSTYLKTIGWEPI